MATFTFTELVRAYFAATWTEQSPPAMRDLMPQESGEPRGDLVALGAARLERLLAGSIQEETDGNALLKLLHSPQVVDLVLTLPADEVMKPFFETLLRLSDDEPLVHYYYGYWLLAYGESRQDDREAAKHYERAAELHEEMAGKLRGWARDVSAAAAQP